MVHYISGVIICAINSVTTNLTKNLTEEKILFIIYFINTHRNPFCEILRYVLLHFNRRYIFMSSIMHTKKTQIKLIKKL